MTDIHFRLACGKKRWTVVGSASAMSTGVKVKLRNPCRRAHRDVSRGQACQGHDMTQHFTLTFCNLYHASVKSPGTINKSVFFHSMTSCRPLYYFKMSINLFKVVYISDEICANFRQH